MTRILIIGTSVLDDIYRIAEPVVSGEKQRALGLATVPGGTSANAAIAIVRLGGQADLLTRIGDDIGGTMLRSLLGAQGVNLALSPPIPGGQTSRSAILVEFSGARTIINNLDPHLPARPDWLPKSLPDGTDAVLCDVRWLEAARPLFLAARDKGIPRVFDGDRGFEDASFLDLVSHAIFSAQGLRELTGIDTLDDALRMVAADRRAFFAVTDGSNGIFSLQADTVIHTPAYRIKAVDTLAAGDVFLGAFAFALAEGHSEISAIRFASAAAAIKCSRAGGGMGAPTRAELLKFLGENAG